MELWGLAENVYYGISLGAVLLLAASGLAITFGVMGVINMAHGEMVMTGAYTTFVVQRLIAAFAPALDQFGLLIAVPAAFVVAGALGVIIERTLIRFLYGRPLETLLATWGLSLILQQAVRSIFGPTNQDVSSPAWMSGSLQLGGLTLTVNRLWIILFATLVLGALMATLRWGGLGRSIRAVTQNRRMAAAMGIRTPLIDALTFGLGSGIAGMAGVALSQIDNVSPNLGQNYIIDSFIVVVVGGVGNLWGTLVGAVLLGVVDKFIEPFAGAVLAKIFVLVAVDSVHPAPPGRAVPAQGPGGRGMIRYDRLTAITLGCVLGVAGLLAALNLFTPPTSAAHVPNFAVSLVGKYLCYAILALAIDLVWGYAGILTLGHGAFFALGGYCMGMYLMREIGARGVYANPILPDFMVFIGWKQLPWYWQGFDHFWFALPMMMIVPGLLAFAFGWFAFRSRVSGVYLSIITQAMTYALMLAFFRNDMGFGGNNGMTDFKDIVGLPLNSEATSAGLMLISCGGVVGGLSARTRHDPLALRQGADRGARCRGPHPVSRLPPRILQAGDLGRLGHAGRDRRRALCTAGRDHQPVRVRAGQLDRGGNLGRGGRSRHPHRRDPRRGPRQSRQDVVDQRAAGDLAVRDRRAVHPRHAAAAARHHRSVDAARPDRRGRAGSEDRARRRGS